MISIIVPVYNEEKSLGEFLQRLPYQDGIETIIADGQSLDATASLARKYPVKIIQTIKNRASQMNAGARIAQGDVFIFLHADCFLGEGSLAAINDCLKKGYIGGCLSQRINSDKIIYRLIEASGNVRARLTKIFYGDQAIFARRDIFLKLGGFDEVLLFEDILFSRKMERQGRVKILSKKVFASSRRWDEGGVAKSTLIYWLLTLGFLLRIPFSRLKMMYNDIR